MNSNLNLEIWRAAQCRVIKLVKELNRARNAEYDNEFMRELQASEIITIEVQIAALRERCDYLWSIYDKT